MARQAPNMLTPDVVKHQLQGTVGNRAVAQLVSQSRTATPQVQRMVMSDRQWIKSSARFGRSRSALLLEIDGALMRYNEAQSQPPATRLDLLKILIRKIYAWQNSKRSGGKIKSARAKAVADLARRARSERTHLQALVKAGSAPQDAEAVIRTVTQLYTRGSHELLKFLGMSPGEKSRNQAKGFWQRFRTEAMRVERAARNLDRDDEDNANAHLAALGLREGMRAFRTITYRHLGVNRRDSDKTRLPRIRDDLDGLIEDLEDGESKEAEIFLRMVRRDINQYANLAGADPEVENKLEALDEDDAVDFDMLEEVLGAIDISTTMTGYQGTGGLGNEGFNEFYKSAPSEGTDDRSKIQKNTAKAFSKWTPDTNKGKDILSGTSDMGNALGGLGSDALTVFQAWKIYKNPNASEEERLEAKMQLAKTPFSTVSNILKFTGGALTARRGDEGSVSDSHFGFTSEGTDVSTDVKMAGDFFGLFSGIIDTIGKVMDLVKYVKDGGDKKAKTQKRTRRKDLEGMGNLLRKYTGTVASLAGNYKSAAKLGYQIAGGGQVAAKEASSVVNLGGLVPGLQLASSVMQAVQHAYKLVRIGMRRLKLTRKLDEFIKEGAHGDVRKVEVVEFAQQSLVKRSHRVGINLGHALASIIAGGFNLSGIGLAAGMVINLSSSAMRIGQIGLRKAKQHGRDKSAKKRNKAGKTESYKNWRHRKRLTSARKGKWSQFKTAMSIKFTYNWDKSRENKKTNTRQVALEILRLDDRDVYDALGVTDALDDEELGLSERLAIVIAALNKRD